MEAYTLKKIMLYSIVAVVLGLILMLTPLIILKEIKTENCYRMLPEAVDPEQLGKLKEVYGLDAPKYSISDFEFLLISFAVASVVYVFFKHRMSSL